MDNEERLTKKVVEENKLRELTRMPVTPEDLEGLDFPEINLPVDTRETVWLNVCEELDKRLADG